MIDNSIRKTYFQTHKEEAKKESLRARNATDSSFIIVCVSPVLLLLLLLIEEWTLNLVQKSRSLPNLILERGLEYKLHLC